MVQILASQGGAGCWGFPSHSKTLPGVGVIGRVCLLLSYLFPREYFLSCSMWRSQSNTVSGFFSEGIAPHIALYFVLSLEEGNSGDSYVTILVIITLLFPLFKCNWKNVEYPSLFKQIFQGNMQKGEENSNPTMKPNTIMNSHNCSLSVCNMIIVSITLRCITVIGSFHLQIHLVCYGHGSATILCISLLSHQTIKCSKLFFKMLCIFWLFSRNQEHTAAQISYTTLFVNNCLSL